MASKDETVELRLKINGDEVKREMESLQRTAVSLNEQLQRAKLGNGKESEKEVKRIEAQLRKVNSQLRTMRSTTINIDEAMGSLSTMKMKDLQYLAKSINKVLNSGAVSRGTKEWKEYQERLQLVKAEMRKISDESKMAQTRMERFNDRLTTWRMSLAAVVGVVMGGRQLYEDFAAKEESQASLKALTGLDDDSIQWLTQQAEQLSTQMDSTGLRIRKSSQEILNAYMLVGSAKPELLADKEALNAVTIEALRLAQAAKIELSDAVSGVTLAMNQYGASAAEAGRYTNVMAAGSKAGAANVQSVTSAVTKAGVAASTAGVPIEQLVGSIEALAEKGITDEVAGTGLKTFFLKLQTGADETNPKVVGLQTALQNLQSLSTEEIVSQFGQEAYSVAQVLIDGADRVDAYTKAVTGSEVAMEQAAINSNTTAAKMAQMKNQITEAGIALYESLNPAITTLGSGLAKVMGVVPPLMGWLGKYGKYLLYLTTVGASYSVGLKLQALWLTVSATRTKVLAAAQALFTGKLNLARRAMLLFNAATKANPLGVLLTALTAVAGAFIVFKSSGEKATESVAQMDVETSKEITRLELLEEALKDNTLSYSARKKALADIQAVVPEYNASLTKEGELIKDNTGALQLYIKQLELTSLAKMAAEKYAEVKLKRDELRAKALKEYGVEWDKLIKDNSIFGEIARETDKALSQEMERYGTLMQKYTKESLEITSHGSSSGTPDGETDPVLQKKIEDIEIAAEKQRIASIQQYNRGEIDLEQHNAKLLEIDKELIRAKMSLQSVGSKEYLSLLRQLLEMEQSEKNKTNEEGDAKRKKKEEEQLALSLLQIEENQRVTERLAKEQYIEGIYNREQYEARLREIELQGIIARQGLYREGSKEYIALQGEMDDLLLEDKLRRQEEYQQQVDRYRNEYLEMSAEEQMDIELQGLETLHAQKLVSEEEYYKMLAGIREKYQSEEEEESDPHHLKKLDEYAKKASLVYGEVNALMQATSNYYSALEAQKVAQVEESYQRQIDAAGDNSEKVEALEKEKAEKIAAVQTEYNNRRANIQIAQAVAETAMAAIKAYTAGWELGPAGVVAAPLFAGMAIAAGVLQVAAIKKQVAAQQGGYYEGGFTGAGPWDEPRGTVHAGEFVANRFAVRNRQILPALELIDYAQRNNTIGRLTAADVTRVLTRGGSPSTQTTGGASPMGGNGDPTQQALLSYVARSEETMSHLKKRLDDGVEAYVTLDGERGLDSQYRRYNKLKNTPKR